MPAIHPVPRFPLASLLYLENRGHFVGRISLKGPSVLFCLHQKNDGLLPKWRQTNIRKHDEQEDSLLLSMCSLVVSKSCCQVCVSDLSRCTVFFLVGLKMQREGAHGCRVNMSSLRQRRCRQKWVKRVHWFSCFVHRDLNSQRFSSWTNLLMSWPKKRQLSTSADSGPRLIEGPFVMTTKTNKQAVLILGWCAYAAWKQAWLF